MELLIGRWRVAVEPQFPSEQTLQTTYDQLAPTWHNSIRRLGFLTAYRTLFSQIALPQKQRPLAVLDAGIGTGGLSEALVSENGRLFNLTGVDLSPAMLNKAHHNLAHRVQRMSLHQHDIQSLRFPDNQFDLVMAAHVLEHLPNPAVGLREMVRVAKPGASILLVMTRRSLASAWLHLTWQIHTATARHLAYQMEVAGLTNIRQLHFRRSWRTNRMSLVFVGTKP